MTERVISPKTYVVVCVLLVLLTVLTVGVSFAPLMGKWHITIGLLIAVCKGTLVALFFMHVLISPRVTWIVIAVALFWLGLLFVLTLNDYVTRDMVPYTPGH
jgi:cytochrome c oxidase subunit IV